MEPNNEVLMGTIQNDASFEPIKNEILKQIAEVVNLIEDNKQAKTELE